MGTKPKNTSEKHIHPLDQLRVPHKQERQEVSVNGLLEEPDPPLELDQEPPGGVILKNRSHQKQKQIISIKVKIRGGSRPLKEWQEVAAGRVLEVSGPTPDSDQKNGGTGARQSKSVQGQDPSVLGMRITLSQPLGPQEVKQQNPERRKPWDPEDPVLRKLFIGNINAANNRADIRKTTLRSLERQKDATAPLGRKKLTRIRSTALSSSRRQPRRMRSRKLGPTRLWDR